MLPLLFAYDFYCSLELLQIVSDYETYAAHDEYQIKGHIRHVSQTDFIDGPQSILMIDRVFGNNVHCIKYECENGLNVYYIISSANYIYIQRSVII